MPVREQPETGELLLTFSVPGIVLDTNVVLDWLLFAEPSVAALAGCVLEARARWWTSRCMRDEFECVLGRGLAQRRGANPQDLLDRWDRLAVQVGAVPAAPPALRCSDGDDQPFIDVALATGARWLVSRDRAVLRLGRRARSHGLQIVSPERWTGEP